MRVFTCCIFFLSFCLSAKGQQSVNEEPVLNNKREISSYYHNQGDVNTHLGFSFLKASSFNFSVLEATGSGNPSPAINLSMDYGLTKEIGLGLFASFYRVEGQTEINFDNNPELFEDLFDDPLCYIACLTGIGTSNCDCEAITGASETVTTRVNVFTIGGKLSYHVLKFEKLDTYGNTYLGYSFNRRKTITESAIDQLLDQANSDNDVPSIVYFASAGMRYFITPQWALYGEFGYGNVHLMQLGLTYRL